MSTPCPHSSFGILADSSRQRTDIRFDLSNHKDVLSFSAENSLDSPWVDSTVYTAAANTDLAREKRVCAWDQPSVCAWVRQWNEHREHCQCQGEGGTENEGWGQ